MIKLILAALVIWGVWLLLRKRPPAVTSSDRNERDARAVLGIDADADADAIRAAHRRLLASVHPDRGGSDELARRINAARDVLLRR